MAKFNWRGSGYGEDKEQLLKRLSRIEGQVRGIKQMIEDDRYCLDVVQQIQALQAAAREVALLVMEDHLRECVAGAMRDNGGAEGEAAIKEMMTVLGRALRQ
jgi:DNA-binding FrmR family transcriptional regulator